MTLSCQCDSIGHCLHRKPLYLPALCGTRRTPEASCASNASQRPVCFVLRLHFCVYIHSTCRHCDVPVRCTNITHDQMIANSACTVQLCKYGVPFCVHSSVMFGTIMQHHMIPNTTVPVNTVCADLHVCPFIRCVQQQHVPFSRRHLCSDAQYLSNSRGCYFLSGANIPAVHYGCLHLMWCCCGRRPAHASYWYGPPHPPPLSPPQICLTQILRICLFLAWHL